MSWGGQEGKILESSWQFLVPEEKFLEPAAVVEQGQTSSQPTKGIPGNATEARSAGELWRLLLCDGIELLLPSESS